MWISSTKRLLHALLLLCSSPGLLAAEPPTKPLAQLKAHSVISAGHPLRVWEKSPKHALARIVLVHGRTWSARADFDLQAVGETLSLMDGLVAAGIATYAVDLRGYGETARDASGWLSPNKAATDLAAVLRWVTKQASVDNNKPHLFGWSYGALVSQLMVQQEPQLAASLSLFGYPLRPSIYGDTTQPSAAEPPAKATNAAAARSDFIVPGNISKRAIDAFVRSALIHDPIRADWHKLHQWRALNPKRIAVPTLLLEAEFDPLALDDEHARFFTNLTISDKRWIMIPGGDHAAFMESPRQQFINALVDFVTRPPQ